ncbi:hypothetical protein EHO60_03185 [Leptospira fletcheri]|uniref:YCII-related domain-containing protein n=1 Tax=Leptospira fletcheri TaxID=2484981 RepID=A0A4R9GIP1_9LEPT|nr:YciI family protein [Leptospira fletcheri]TGK12891.1 hypothetical protein EHO60_03185 [Leptospira fletcheri]
MKFFLIELRYTSSLEKIEAAVVEHRAFLQTLYDRGILLLSGPKEPRIGGMILGKANSKEEMQNLLREDPFQKQGLAEVSFTEFHPVKYQKFLENWISAP